MTANHLSKVVIVGASLAGLTAAEGLRAEGFDGDILLIGAEPDLPYARPPLSKQVLVGDWEPEQTRLRSSSELARLGIRVTTGSAATGVDVRRKEVHLDDESIDYDVLIVATGVRARRPEIAGDGEVHTLRTLADSRSLRTRLVGAQRLTVLGSGVLGSEIASALRATGRQVTIVGRSGGLSLGTTGYLLSDRLSRLHEQHGVELRLGEGVCGVQEPGIVRLEGGSVIESDLVLAATGGTAAVEWLHDTGLEISDGVVCDERGAAAPDIYAIGDVARWRDPVSGTHKRVEHQTNAIEQAMAVAATIMGGTEQPPRSPFFWSEIHGTRIQVCGTFDDGTPLSVMDADEASERFVLVSRHDEEVRGVVGWNSARSFREARKLVDQKTGSRLCRADAALHRKGKEA